MQSFSSKEEEKLLQAHEYIRDTLSSFGHKNCISCATRTEFTCIKCGYCYSCHWKKEQIEEIELRDDLKDFYSSLSKVRVDEDDNDKSKLRDETRDQGLEKWGTLNVLGQPAEPICTYFRCHHKFSLHGSRSCRCKHPTNKTLEIQVRYLKQYNFRKVK
jgi:hypothetical protein